MKKKKGLIIIVGVIVIFLIATTIFLLKQNEVSFFTPSNEKIAEKVGGLYYENSYYKNLTKNKTESELIEYLSNYSETGLTINLENLLIYNNDEFKDDIDKIVNRKTNEPCNIKTTYITIYPKEPYGEKDYTITVNLDCE